MRARPAVTKGGSNSTGVAQGGGSSTAWLRTAAVARAQCSGAAQKWLCRLGRARLLEAGLGTGRGSVVVATGAGGSRRRQLRLLKTRARLGEGE